MKKTMKLMATAIALLVTLGAMTACLAGCNHAAVHVPEIIVPMSTTSSSGTDEADTTTVSTTTTEATVSTTSTTATTTTVKPTTTSTTASTTKAPTKVTQKTASQKEQNELAEITEDNMTVEEKEAIDALKKTCYFCGGTPGRHHHNWRTDRECSCCGQFVKANTCHDCP